jgi:hypothetical protein
MEQKKQTVQKPKQKVVNSPFPKKLYVYKEEAGNEVFYVAQTKTEDCIGSDETNKLVAVYEISGLAVLKVNIEENPVEAE